MSVDPDTFRLADMPALSRAKGGPSPWRDLFDRWLDAGPGRAGSVAAPEGARAREALRRAFCRERARRGLGECVAYRYTNGLFLWWVVDDESDVRIHSERQPNPGGAMPLNPDSAVIYGLAVSDTVREYNGAPVGSDPFADVPPDDLPRLALWLDAHGKRARDMAAERLIATAIMFSTAGLDDVDWADCADVASAWEDLAVALRVGRNRAVVGCLDPDRYDVRYVLVAWPVETAPMLFAFDIRKPGSTWQREMTAEIGSGGLGEVADQVDVILDWHDAGSQRR
jgi:hypothetical protein